MAARPRARPRRSAGAAQSRAQVVRIGVHLRNGPDRSRSHPRRDRRDGPRRRDVARQTRHVRANRRHQGALRRLHDHHAEPQRTTPDTRSRWPGRTRGGAARQDRSGPAAGAPARRERAQSRGVGGRPKPQSDRRTRSRVCRWNKAGRAGGAGGAGRRAGRANHPTSVTLSPLDHDSVADRLPPRAWPPGRCCRRRLAASSASASSPTRRMSRRVLDDPLLILLAWTLGGIVALLGSVVWAELASRFPEVGGQYVYLQRAFHPVVGFLYGVALMFIINGGSLAAVSILFASYVDRSIVAAWPARHSRARRRDAGRADRGQRRRRARRQVDEQHADGGEGRRHDGARRAGVRARIDAGDDIRLHAACRQARRICS